jgi:hypothetical protein
MNYPYSDNFMVFDEENKRYVLTNEYVMQRLGVDLAGTANERGLVNPQIAVKHLLEEVSDDIYNFIHSHNLNTAKQDYLIATVPSLRLIIQKAMGQQLLYSRMNGFMAYSADKDKQFMAICPKARQTLLQVVPEIGISILYTGVI